MLCEVTKAMKDDRDKFKDVEVVVKSKQNNEHEFQLEPMPLHEPDDQVSDCVELEPLLHEPDEKGHSVNELIAQIPVSVIDLQLLPQYDQGGGDVQHDVDKDQEHGVDRI